MGSSLKGMVNSYLLLLTTPEEAADLLGFSGLESRVYFRDAVVDSQYQVFKLGRQWRPRKLCNGIKVYPLDRPSPTREEIYFQAIPPQSTFTAEIVLNGDQRDLQLLIASMGAGKYGVKIGRGKDRGYGIIKLKDLKVLTLKGSKVEVSNILSGAQQIIAGRWNIVKFAFFPR